MKKSMFRFACRADWRGDCSVSVAAKSESLVWVVADHFSVSGSPLIPQP